MPIPPDGRRGETPGTVCGHHVVSRFFGPVRYRAVAGEE
jgi:hypothetical protein